MSVSPTQCPARDFLEAIAVGHATVPAIDEHLASCDECRQALQRMREDNRFLSGFAVNGALPAIPPPPPTPDIEVPGYEIVREIRRGGQGVVYQAVQRATKRDVAIKVMRQGPFATLADRGRFEREIETLGRLEHPNIVAVTDAGAVAGFHYFVMNYVDGKPLDEAIVDLRAENADRKAVQAWVLGVFIKICEAVHAAHLRGVIHRDLKPSNIRVDRSGEPHVLDFGLAKSDDTPADSAMTRTGQFVGSLPWASPEQVEGASARIDLRTDVYSLGAILFQLLTGALPFDLGSNLRDVFDRILLREPPRPSTIVSASGKPRTDDELDTIVLKCLSKEPIRRYQSAGELALDLRRYLAGDPIEAKRDSAMYVLRKTLRRYRLRVTAAAAFVILLAVFGVVMAILYRRSSRLERDAVRSAETLSKLLSQSNIEQGRMAGMLGNLDGAEQLLWGELLTHRPAGEDSAPRFNEPSGPPAAYWALWETYRRRPCLRTILVPEIGAPAVCAAEDGTSVWTLGSGGMLQRLDELGRVSDSYTLGSRTELGLTAVSANGNCVITAASGRNKVWRRGGGDEPLLEIEFPSSADATGICVSRTGERVAAVVDDAAILWSTTPFAEMARFSGEQGALVAVALSNDEKRLATRKASGRLCVWDIASKQCVWRSPPIPPPRTITHTAGTLLFSPDDRHLADAWWEIPGRIWDVNDDAATPIELSESAASYRVQNFSPDGSLLAVGDYVGTLRIFDTHTGQRLSAFVAHPGRVRSAVFTGDSRRVWTCGDRELRLWEVDPDAGVRVVRIGDDVFHCVDISPDGRWLATGGGSGKLHRIDRGTGAVSSLAFGSDATISSVAISPDSSRIAVATYANVVYLWPVAGLDQSPTRLEHPGRVSYLCFSSDGRRLATACDDAVVRLWRAADGTFERELRAGTVRVPQVAFDPAGARLAAAGRDGALLVWNLTTGAMETWAAPTRTARRAVRYSRDGRWLATAGAERVIQVWDAATRELAGSLIGHNQEIYCVDLSPDGELIASGDTGGAIRLWDLKLREPLATLEGHTGAVMELRFSPESRLLASASLDGTVRLWDLSYYKQHIAGQVEAQLRKRESIGDEAHAAAWRAWAERTMHGRSAHTPDGSQ